jgi:hypothetical protein
VADGVGDRRTTTSLARAPSSTPVIGIVFSEIGLPSDEGGCPDAAPRPVGGRSPGRARHEHVVRGHDYPDEFGTGLELILDSL